MELAGLHSSDPMKRSEQARKNRPDMSRVTGELNWNYACLKRKVKKKWWVDTLYWWIFTKTSPGSTQTLFWLHNKAHPPTAAEGECRRRAQERLISTWSSSISVQFACQTSMVCASLAAFDEWIFLIVLLVLSKSEMHRKAGGMAAHSVCRWAALGRHNSLLCRV